VTDKSHVGMGYDLCPVCTVKHNETVLLNKRLKDTLARENFTGWSMCAEHQKLKDEGYVALVVATNAEEGPTLSNALRTGALMHIRESAWPNITSAPVPPQGMAFITPETFEKIKAMSGDES
jgi:hypothetical protein